jgi:hypothetical protein
MRLTFDEHEKSPWFQLVEAPSMPGCYELRHRSGAEVYKGYYREGYWSVEMLGDSTLLKVGLEQWRWRGLIADPATLKARVPRFPNGWVHDWSDPGGFRPI